MAIISSESTRTSGRASSYATKDAVAVSAIHATAPGFERRLREIRRAHGKDGLRPRAETDENGKARRDENGAVVIAKDSKGNPVYEARYVEAYSLVQSFGHDELDPADPESWMRANTLGRAVAEDRFPGHPALVATEVNGRSGCVHNHIIVGNVHPETGGSIDSNVVTHSRLALAHDRVLAEQGFAQPADMERIGREAAEKVAQRRAEVEAEPGFSDLSPSQQERRLVVAEKSVRLEGGRDTAEQKRDARRRRELVRYEQNEVDREIALELGVTPPAEKFSEIELEGRIRKTLRDPRSQSWEAVAEVGREHGVTVDRRGENDVVYGMMLAQPDGTLAEPSRAHRRRGGVEGAKTQGLGEGFRRGDVEAAIGRNAQLQERLEKDRAEQHRAQAARMDELEREQEGQAARVAERLEARAAEAGRMEQANGDELAALQGRLDGTNKEGAAGEVVAQVEPTAQDSAEEAAVAPEAGPAFRSRLRDRRVRDARSRAKLDAVAQLEEDYHGCRPDAAFEERANATKILGERFVKNYREDMSPEFRAHLEARAAQAAERSRAFDERTALEASDEQGRRFYDAYLERIETARKQGDYGSHEHERAEYLDEALGAPGANGAERGVDMARLRDRIEKTLADRRADRETVKGREQGQDLGMGRG